MSIILESLNKNQPPPEESLPGIHSSHYDDEMQDDDWLRRRVKHWQLMSGLLLTVLLLSWGYFLWQQNATNRLLEKTLQVSATVPSSPSITSEDASLQKREQTILEHKPVSVNRPLQSVNIEAETSSSPPAAKKRVYRPEQRSSETSRESTRTTTVSSEPESIPAVKPQTKAPSTLEPVFFEDLPEALKLSFPPLVVNSYVVAEEAESSFVILDGKFYQINQVIAPQLILRAINNEHILVEYHQYRVKLPHKG